PCNGGPCDACSVAAGATMNGHCDLFTGTPCDDGNACTRTDACQAGVCVGANPVMCPAPDLCHTVGLCDPSTGICNNANPVMCVAKDACHLPGQCDPKTGLCSNPEKPDGQPCDDGDSCTQTDTCKKGVCVRSDPVMCVAKDA